MHAAALDLRDLTEKAWDGQLFASRTGLAPMLGWNLTYHTLRSKGSRSGFPDRVLVRDRVIYVELKSETGQPSPAQVEWLDALAAAGQECYLWRPSDLPEIARVLTYRDGRVRVADALHPLSIWLPGIGRADTTEQQTLLTKGAA